MVPPAEDHFVIDLATALQLAESQNPQMALARERVAEAVAQHKEARALWLPTLTAGTNYHLHNGVLQSADGLIRSVNSQSVYVGSGAGAIGSSTVAIPGVRIFGHMGDIYYLPLAARQMATVRAFESHAVDNLTLMDVADRYLTLVRSRNASRGDSGINDAARNWRDHSHAQGTFVRAGQGRDADYRRGRSEFLLMKLQEQQAEEDAAVAAAELSRLLHLDPSVRLVTPAGPIEILELIDETQNVELLVVEAMHQRPEVAARSAEIGAAEFRLRDERMRPWLPLISVGFSAGAFGGGSNAQNLGVPSFYQTTAGRSDFDVFALWTAQNLGTGNRAWQGMRGAEMEQAVMQRALTLAQIRREVTLRQAQSRARRRQIDVSWIQLSAAERGAEEEFQRNPRRKMLYRSESTQQCDSTCRVSTTIARCRHRIQSRGAKAVRFHGSNPKRIDSIPRRNVLNGPECSPTADRTIADTTKQGRQLLES